MINFNEPTAANAIASMERHEKYIVLGVIASRLAYDDGESLDWHYRCAPPLYFVADFVPVSIDDFIPQLEHLNTDALLELCETLATQLRESLEAQR
jgi:hypothetical protein